jgi:hypothetical protein
MKCLGCGSVDDFRQVIRMSGQGMEWRGSVVHRCRVCDQEWVEELPRQWAPTLEDPPTPMAHGEAAGRDGHGAAPVR